MLNKIQLRFEIDRHREVPLYTQISQHLEAMIERGELKPGDRIPAEEELAEAFDVSRPTINKAINFLLRKSVLVRERGRGTYVRRSDVKLTLMHELASLHDAMKRNGTSFHTIILDQRIMLAPATVASELDLKSGKKVVFLSRLRYVEGEPMLISDSYLPADRFPGLEKRELQDGSLYDTLEFAFGNPIEKTERKARAVRALDREARLFHVPIGEPLMQLEGIAFAASGAKVEYFRTLIRGDRAVLFTTLYRDRR